MGAISGDDFELSLQNLINMGRDHVKFLQGELMRSGRPPGTAKLDAKGQYEKLVQLSIQRDPRVVGNPDAMAELQRLARIYGNPGHPQLPEAPRGL